LALINWIRSVTNCFLGSGEVLVCRSLMKIFCWVQALLLALAFYTHWYPVIIVICVFFFPTRVW
jgi:hypothetical protein